MRRRIVWSRPLVLSFSLLLSLGGTYLSFGQTQQCPGCYPPSTVAPTYPQPSVPTYPSNPSSSSAYPTSGAPRTSASGWTAPVPNTFTVNQAGQVIFYYGSPYSRMQQSVPVTGINPFTTFNGMNGMPHWSSMTSAVDQGKLIYRYYSSPSNYSSVYTPSPLSSPWQ